MIDRRQLLLGTSAAGAMMAVPFKVVGASTRLPPWEKLAAAVGDRLLQVRSPMDECVASGGVGADELFRRTLKNPYAITDDPTLTQTLSWTGAWRTQAPARVIRARSASDVAAAVNFARRYGVRPVVRGGAHSYFGNSNGAGSLLIWTRDMDAVVQHDAFVPSGAPAQTASTTAVSIGSGALWGDVYRKTMVEAGRFVQGGGCLTVGVAGFIMGGGFGSLSKLFGTGASNLLEAEVVTADGMVRTVSAHRDPDLFFALKGGGGGSFAVVTRLTLATHPLPASIGGILLKAQARDDAAWRELVGAVMDLYATRLFNSHWGEQISFGPDRRLAITMVAAGRREPQIRDDWAPLIEWMRARPDRIELAGDPMVLVTAGRQFWDPRFLRSLPGLTLADDRLGASPDHLFWAANRGEAGQQILAYKSRWMPQSLLAEGMRGRFCDAIVAGARHWSVTLHTNKGLAGGSPEAIARTAQTATNRQVLDAFALLIVAASDEPAWPGVKGYEPDARKARDDAARVNAAFAPLAALTPNAGCYISEADWSNPGWKRDYWGDNFPRLLATKRRYDPAGLFTGHHCVGT